MEFMMNEKRGAGAVLVTGHPAICGQFPRSLLDTLKLPALATIGAIFLALLILREPSASLVFAEADEILLRLTALGREGAAVLCNPQSIERRLSVRIDENSLNKGSVSNFSNFAEMPKQAVFGSYSKFQSNGSTICRLQLRVSGHRFCDTDSARVQRLIGRRLQPRLATLDESGIYDHGYELLRDARTRTVIGWREPGRSCPADVEIVTASR